MFVVMVVVSDFFFSCVCVLSTWVVVDCCAHKTDSNSGSNDDRC